MASEGHTRKYCLSATLRLLILLGFFKSYNFTPTIEKVVDFCRRPFAIIYGQHEKAFFIKPRHILIASGDLFFW